MRRRAPPLITENSQAFTFTRRAMVLGALQGGVAAILAGRLGYIAIAENERYKLLAEGNRVHMQLIPPRRGWIVDRQGQPIAINRSDFRVDLIPDRLRDSERIIAELTKILGLSSDEIERIHDDLKGAAGYQPVAVAENLSFEKFAAVTVRLPELPGVSPLRAFSRFYPDGAAVGHLIGYVGIPNRKEYEAENKAPLLLTPGFKIGKQGLEKTMEERLRGQPGAKRVEVTARGKLVRELSTLADKSGAPMPLTIDAGLQTYAARRLGNESGSVVVIDLHNGDILAMASMPAYDPNSFSDGISHDEWNMLSADQRHPLINKSLNALYPPGSTIKPMVAMALLGAGVKPEETVSCGGGYNLGNRFFRCLGRHGPMNMHRAIAKSCNTYFYAMGRRVGYDHIAGYARQLGLGAKYDLPVESQSFGTVPDSEWKRRKYKQEWTQSDTLNASIGQGYLIVNPLQLAVMSARIASGKNLQPRLIGGDRTVPKALPMPAEHFETVRSGMWEVVNGNGTAGRSRLQLPGIEMGGKTGTAQVRRIAGSQRGQGGEWKYRDHGLFVCFAPTDNPRYAASVVIEHGMGGSRAAAPVAKDVLTYLFDKQKAMEALLPMEEGWGGDIAKRMEAQAAAWVAGKPAREAQAAAEAALKASQGTA
ncbi:penicillin-binding protein 2 [Allosphingosinicella indica]|uniref:Peptidoglycan glycosyltransferase n=1 Tax=Allosphingosinicella indica TaxID=941907 RepID=A0A1X7H2R7_9SPHN|nr:penicillin-binding protein 2 [Allosphingosinicella indica]SMF78433.1 peptidoglycan glycosyltransferase [Allosphingosinicella indica]